MSDTHQVRVEHVTRRVRGGLAGADMCVGNWSQHVEVAMPVGARDHDGVRHCLERLFARAVAGSVAAARKVDVEHGGRQRDLERRRCPLGLGCGRCGVPSQFEEGGRRGVQFDGRVDKRSNGEGRKGGRYAEGQTGAGRARSWEGGLAWVG